MRIKKKTIASKLGIQSLILRRDQTGHMGSKFISHIQKNERNNIRKIVPLLFFAFLDMKNCEKSQRKRLKSETIGEWR